MKKFLSLMLVLCLALALAPAAVADVTVPQTGVVATVENGAQIDLDLDGTPETVTFEVLAESWDDPAYVKLHVGDAELTVEGWYMDEEVRLLQVSEYQNPFLLVFDYGPSDDPDTHFIYYDEGALIDAGSICARPENFRVQDEIITAQGVRGNVLYTWFHPADYVIATSFGDYDFETETFSNPRPRYRVCPLPRETYPMGLIVTALRDIPLIDRIGGTEVVGVIPAGNDLMLSATDDRQWIYLVGGEYNELCGWVQLDTEYGTYCLIDGEQVIGSDVFQGLLFAD